MPEHKEVVATLMTVTSTVMGFSLVAMTISAHQPGRGFFARIAPIYLVFTFVLGGVQILLGWWWMYRGVSDALYSVQAWLAFAVVGYTVVLVAVVALFLRPSDQALNTHRSTAGLDSGART